MTLLFFFEPDKIKILSHEKQGEISNPFPFLPQISYSCMPSWSHNGWELYDKWKLLEWIYRMEYSIRRV